MTVVPMKPVLEVSLEEVLFRIPSKVNGCRIRPSSNEVGCYDWDLSGPELYCVLSSVATPLHPKMLAIYRNIVKYHAEGSESEFSVRMGGVTEGRHNICDVLKMEGTVHWRNIDVTFVPSDNRFMGKVIRGQYGNGWVQNLLQLRQALDGEYGNSGPRDLLQFDVQSHVPGMGNRGENDREYLTVRMEMSLDEEYVASWPAGDHMEHVLKTERNYELMQLFYDFLPFGKPRNE